MPLYKLFRVQVAVNLLEILIIPLVVVNIRNEAIAQLLNIVYGNVNVHLLLSIRHKVVFWETIVHDLLFQLCLASFFLIKTSAEML
jgi:hypothetical protein